MSNGNTNNIQVKGVTCSFLYPFITHRNGINCNSLNAKEKFKWEENSGGIKKKFGRLKDFLAIHDNWNVPESVLTQKEQITNRTVFAISMEWGWWECIKEFDKVSLDKIKQEIKDNLGDTNQSGTTHFSECIDNFLQSKLPASFPSLPLLIIKEEETLLQTKTKSIESLETKLIRYGISDENQSLPEPFVIITGSVSNSTPLEIIKENDCFELLMYRRPSDCKNKEQKNTNQDKNKKHEHEHEHEHEHKNYAFGDKWICYCGPRVLFMLMSAADHDDEQRIKELMNETHQAIAFVYTLTAELRLINNELDILLNKNLAELTHLYSQGNKKCKILKTFLGELVALRQRHVRTLSDPVFYAFPPGTIHDIIKKARKNFLTDIAEKRLQTKFDNIDRLIDDSLQVGALA